MSTTMGESFTIQISSNLGSRLADDHGKLKRKIKKPRPKITPQSQQPQITADQQSLNGSVMSNGVSNGRWPLQSPMVLPPLPPLQPAASAELDAVHSVVQPSESVLERLQKQEAKMVQEVTQRAKELHAKEFKLPFQERLPCLAEKDACLECYGEYAKDPLRSAQLVKKFADCAHFAITPDD